MNAYLIHSKLGSLEKLRSLYRGNVFEKKEEDILTTNYSYPLHIQS